MKNVILGGFLLFFSFIAKAQAPSIDTLSKDASKEKALLDAVTTRHNKDIASLSGTNKKYIAEIYKERYESIKEKFTENEIISDTKASGYLAKLTGEILKLFLL